MRAEKITGQLIEIFLRDDEEANATRRIIKHIVFYKVHPASD